MTSAPDPDATQLSTAAIVVLLFIVVMSLIGFGIMLPMLPFFGHLFDAAPWQVTLLFSAFSAGQFAGELSWGRLSDRIGRRPVLIATIVISAAGYFAIAYAPGIWIAILIRIAQGFFAGNISVIQGYVVDVTPTDQLAGRLGLIGTAFGTGMVIGPALGGLMAQPELGLAGFRPALYLGAALSVVAAIGLLVFVKESRVRRAASPAASQSVVATLKIAAAHPVLAPTFLTIFLSFFAGSALFPILGLWGEARYGWGAREVGLTFAVTGLASAVAQGLFAGLVVRKLGAGGAIAAALLGASVCLLVVAASPWEWLAVLAITVSVFGTSLWQPAAMSLVSFSADPERQGAFLGAAGAAGSAARVLGPVLGGAMFSVLGATAPLVGAAILMTPAAWLGWRAGSAMRRHNPAGA